MCSSPPPPPPTSSASPTLTPLATSHLTPVEGGGSWVTPPSPYHTHHPVYRLYSHPLSHPKLHIHTPPHSSSSSSSYSSPSPHPSQLSMFTVIYIWL